MKVFFQLGLVGILSVFLMSCSITPSPRMGGAPQSAPLPMAESRGLNDKMIDARLQEMVREATSIEVQMGALLDRLNMLRADINGYEKTLVDQTELTMIDQAEQLPAQILPVPEKPKAAPVKAEAKPQQKKTEPAVKAVKKASAPMKPGVNDLRIGIHKDKTRIVLDVNGSLKNTVNFDSQSGLLTVTMPETGWSGANTKTYTLDQLKGYEAKPDGEGSVIAFAVDKTSSVKTSAIKKSGDKPARLVIDLVK